MNMKKMLFDQDLVKNEARREVFINRLEFQHKMHKLVLNNL